MSRSLMIGLCVVYVIIALFSMKEGRGWQGFYWLMATGLNIAVLQMNK